jgi:hypothetical protein
MAFQCAEKGVHHLGTVKGWLNLGLKDLTGYNNRCFAKGGFSRISTQICPERAAKASKKCPSSPTSD